MIGAKEVSLTAMGQSGGKLAELYGQHSARAVRLAYLLTGNRELAEDLAQEAFGKVIGRFGDLRKPEAFAAYLNTAIVNLSKSHFRRSKIERAYLARTKAEAHPQRSDLPDVEVRTELRSALMALPHRQRAAVVLRFYEDLSEDQAGHILGCSPIAIRSLVARGMESLRNQIKPSSEIADRRQR